VVSSLVLAIIFSPPPVVGVALGSVVEVGIEL